MNINSTAEHASQALGGVGMNCVIAIAVGILVLVSSIMLASYVCVRIQGIVRALGLDQYLPGAVVDAGLRSDHPSKDCLMGGLDQESLEKCPKFVLSSQCPLPHADATACSICLSEFNDSELLRMLPDCHHVFHAGCIDSWLRKHPTCPMCRTFPIPTPPSKLLLTGDPLDTELSVSSD